jgi:hypothetical protein
MSNRADELQRAAAGAARRKVAQGIPPRDPVAAGQQLSGRPRVPTKYLYIIALISGLAVLGLVLSLLANVAPSHVLLIAVVVLWGGWGIWRRKK